MMKILSRTIIIALSLLLLSVCSTEAAEVVVLKSADIRPYNEALEGFRSSFSCRTREFLVNGAEDQHLLKKIMEIKPDMVLAIGLDALAHTLLIKDLPVVYTMVPQSSSINLAGRRNISGVSMFIPAQKYIDTIAEVFQGAKRIGLIFDPKNTEPFVKEALQAAQARGIDLVLKKASRLSEVPSQIDWMKDKIDVFWMVPDTTIINAETVNYMLLFSYQNRVPVFTFSKKYAEMGAVASLNIVPFDLGVQAAEIAKKLLYDNASSIRIDARKPALTINKKVARKLGIRVREDILKRADDVD